MSTLKFKTNINCGNCIRAITPQLNATPGIQHWEVDINDPGKTLTVEAAELTPEQLVAVLRRAGFTAEPI